ncbi:glycine hydroxymethyltransferase [Acrasis kona]|uniref:Serine hydroxymethyltransferase n=1 Tax=Acrasis kona TaxID=1008807 RepID=A0AAW2Z1G5_9EUKA
MSKLILRSVRALASANRRLYSTGQKNILNARLEEIDPEIYDIIEYEKNRQYRGLQLIPSENFTSRSVLDALGSIMQNKYSEGYPGKRYYGGNEYIDKAEIMCQKRALAAFKLNEEEWGVNVQPLSGSPANFYVYSALLQTHDRIMSLDLTHGGHLSHGHQTPTKKISAVSKFFETVPYRLNEQTGIIDYDKLEEHAAVFRPKLIVAGTSSYSRAIDYARMRKICDQQNAILLADMAHISGLVAAGVVPTPFEYADIVTTTTHKSLRGPRGAMIFFRRGPKKNYKPKKGAENEAPPVYDYEEKINQSVFPGHQGGPHNHTITALAVALKQATTQEYISYQKQVLANSKSLCEKIKNLGYKVVSGGTDNHLMLIDLKDKGIDGARVERVLELVSIAVNKNTVPGDKSALVPGGIRVGTPALTTRGLDEKDFESVAEFIHEGVEIAKKVAQSTSGTKFVDFNQTLSSSDNKGFGIQELDQKVQQFSKKFDAIGFDKETMKYK